MSETPKKVDREQIRRDAEAISQWTDEDQHWATVMAHHCLALLAELEQAEKKATDLAGALEWAIDWLEKSGGNPQPNAAGYLRDVLDAWNENQQAE